MNSYQFLGLAVCLLAGSNCRTTPSPAAKAPRMQESQATLASAPESMRALEFRRGKALLESGNHMAAIKQFAYLRDHAESTEERDRAVIGLSMALQDSGKSGAALGTLEPLPELPQNRTEAMKCILAGELYLHQKNYPLARTWLIRGLEAEPESRKRHRAPGFFNLGKALLAEDNLEDAQAAFQEAQDIFTLHGDEHNAKQCQVILADIRRSLV